MVWQMSYTEPLILIFLTICIFGSIRIRTCQRKTILAIGLVGLFLISWPPAQWLLSRPLEDSYKIRPFRSSLPPQAIVVLGGAIYPPHFEQPYALPDRDTFEHCAMAAWIYKQTGPVPVLGCEGSQEQGNYPSVMRELLRGGGIPDDLIWIEDRSHNTHENATYGSAILKQHGIRQIALVTDAQSMRRAAACFRKLGMTVIPAPCDFGQLDLSYETFIPTWKAIRRNERTLHEALGLAWYSLRGWI
jgi:uncharacterized SAM-binding protein YcdF (DUF218 family)